jgi:hypothetical protein
MLFNPTKRVIDPSLSCSSPLTFHSLMLLLVDVFRDEGDCLHFLYKFALLLPSIKGSGDAQQTAALAQAVHSTMHYPWGMLADLQQQ